MNPKEWLNLLALILSPERQGYIRPEFSIATLGPNEARV